MKISRDLPSELIVHFTAVKEKTDVYGFKYQECEKAFRKENGELLLSSGVVNNAIVSSEYLIDNFDWFIWSE